MLVGTQFGIESKGGRWSLKRIDVLPRPLTERAMLGRFIGEFDGPVRLTQTILLDVVFGRDSAAPSVREQSVVHTMNAIRDCICTKLMPALAAFFPGEYAVTISTTH